MFGSNCRAGRPTSDGINTTSGESVKDADSLLPPHKPPRGAPSMMGPTTAPKLSLIFTGRTAQIVRTRLQLSAKD